MLASGSGIGPVVALAGQNQDKIAGACEPQGVGGQALSDEANDFRLGLTGGQVAFSHSRICATLITGIGIPRY